MVLRRLDYGQPYVAVAPEDARRRGDPRRAAADDDDVEVAGRT